MWRLSCRQNEPIQSEKDREILSVISWYLIIRIPLFVNPFWRKVVLVNVNDRKFQTKNYLIESKILINVSFVGYVSFWYFGLKTASKLRNSLCSSKNIVYTYRLGWVPTLHVLIAVPMKVQIFWVITWYLLVKNFWHFGGTCCLHLQGARCTRRLDFLNSEDGGKKLSGNVGNLESIYTASYPKGLQSLYTVLLKTLLLF